MQIFYNQHITDQIILDPEESRHCLKVLRKKIGDELQITDGKGNLFLYSISSIDTKTCKLKLVEQIKSATTSDFHIHIAIAPTKNTDRMEWFVEKATELGVHEISLILTKNSERKFAKTDRLIKKSISAMKQSGNLYLPIINELKPLKDFLNDIGSRNEKKYIAYVPTDQTKILFEQALKNERYNVLIGPEGDFRQDEVDLAISTGFTCVSLGKTVLRTETAGIVAVQQLSLLNH